MKKDSDLGMATSESPPSAAAFLEDLDFLLAATKDGGELSALGDEQQVVQCTVLIEALQAMGHKVSMAYTEARALIPGAAISFEGWVMGVQVGCAHSFLVDPFGAKGQEAIEADLRAKLLAELAINHSGIPSHEYAFEAVSWAPPSQQSLSLMLSYCDDVRPKPNFPSIQELTDRSLAIARSMVQSRDLQGQTSPAPSSPRTRF